MELKEELKKPYTKEQRLDFITNVIYKKHYELRETVRALQAWGKTDAEILEDLKKEKYDEANRGAKNFLESGDALYEFAPGKHIEAFDGNMSKMTGYLLAFESGIYQPGDTVVWVTKEDEIVNLTREQIADILVGISKVQASVWSVQFPAYVAQIEAAKTISEVQGIVIKYNDKIS